MGAPGQAVLCGSRIAASNRVWEELEDTPVTGWTKTNDFIIATGLETEAGMKIASDVQLQWRDNNDGTPTWVALAATGEMKFGATDLVNDAAVTSGEAGTTRSATQTWQDGEEIEGANDGAFNQASNDYWTELQYSVSPADATDEHEYEFRVWDVSDSVEAGVCAAKITMAAAAAETWTPEADDDATVAEYSDLRIPKSSRAVDDDAEVSEFQNLKVSVRPGVDDDVGVSEFQKLHVPVRESAGDDAKLSEFQELRVPKMYVTVDDDFGIVEDVQVSIAVAGETLTIDVFDSIATSEYIDQLLGKYFISTNEAIEINEATSERLPKVSLDVADSVDTSESIDRLLDKYFVGTHESLEVDELFASKIPILKLSIADSVTVLDFNTLRTPKFKLSVSDTIGTAEVIGRHEKSFLDLSENIDIAEFIQLVLKRLLISESDNLSVAEFDELLKSGGFDPEVNDDVTLQEAVTLLLKLYFTDVDDVLNVSEYLNIRVKDNQHFVETFDKVAISEIITLILKKYITSASDNVTISELVSALLKKYIVSTADSATVNESISLVLKQYFLDDLENVTVSEFTNAVIKQLYISASDQLGLSEYLNVHVSALNAILLSVDDDVTLSESVSILLNRYLADVDDDISLNESVSLILKQCFVEVSDDITLSESQTLLLKQYLVNNSDNLDVAEYIKIVIKSYSSSLSDALGISEYVNLNHVHDYLYYLTAFDSVAITESITVVMNKRFANIYDFFGLTEWSDVLITVGAITDADRLIIVSAEDRFMNVSAEDRFIHVPFEDRFINPGD